VVQHRGREPTMGWLSKVFGREKTRVKTRAKKVEHAHPKVAKAASKVRQKVDDAHEHASDLKSGIVTAAHQQALTLHMLTHIPRHHPREEDPHYHLFEQAKARLKRQGLWKCIIDDDLCDGQPELHHTHVEFSQINQVDEKKIMQALGLHFETDEDFQKWAESPGNLEVLCANHHRAHYGIHVIPGPLWEALRFHKTGTGPAAEFIPADEVEAASAGIGDDEKPAAKKAAR
jgi:hypothetical protein